MFDFIELKTIFIIFHLLGVVLGMGAAFMTDLMFVRSAKDKVIDTKELSFISLGSKTVWVGLFVIIISGAMLFYLDAERYLNSSKFLTKMVVVLVLTINGLFFHFKHLPFLRSQVDKNLGLSDKFIGKSKGLFVSGGISSASWVTALILGVFRGIPYSFQTLTSVYVIILVFAMLGAFVARHMFLAK